MNRFIQSDEGTVLFRMSVDAEYYKEGKGSFIVRYQHSETKFFSTLLEAFLFYYTVDEEAELWDNTDYPVFIENKVKLYLN